MWWYGTFRRSWGQEGGALINGISVLMKDTSEKSLPAFTRWEHSEKTAIYAPWSRLSPDTKFASTLILNFPASRTMRNECLIYPFYGIFAMAAQVDWDSEDYEISLIHIISSGKNYMEMIWKQYLTFFFPFPSAFLIYSPFSHSSLLNFYSKYQEANKV